MRATAPPKIIEVDTATIAALLERSKGQHAVEDHALYEGICQSFIELQMRIRQQRTTIAQLRRLVGTTSSEKSARVMGGDGHAAPRADENTNDTGANDRETAPKPDGNEPKPKGHGRIKATDYPDAEHIAVVHETLCPKDRCPACNRGTLYRMKEPVRFL